MSTNRVVGIALATVVAASTPTVANAFGGGRGLSHGLLGAGIGGAVGGGSGAAIGGALGAGAGLARDRREAELIDNEMSWLEMERRILEA